MLVFTYGTLKRGYHNHSLLEGSRFIGNARTRKTYAMVEAGFPVLLGPTLWGYPVEGEVYEVDKATMADLDRLEGVGRMYDRVRHYVEMEATVGTLGALVRVYYYVGRREYWGPRINDRRILAVGHNNGVYDWRPGYGLAAHAG